MLIRAITVGWVVAVVSGIASSANAFDAPPMLVDTAGDADVSLVAVDHVADVYVDADDFPVARHAAALFSRDVRRVTTREPRVVNDAGALGATAVIVGTLGHSALVDQLVADGKLDVSALRGKWESFLIATVERPLPNVERALVIVGSDRRGTAFGVFEMSEQIGVSPWYWWADVAPTRRDALVIHAGTHLVGPPSVKYRGIFINDEDWGLKPWAAQTFDPERGNIGPKTYARVFELMLRLKANYLWPAMHPCSTEFGAIDENIALADEWGIVMGASHAEPMNRNNVWWHDDGVGAWRYDTNRANVINYWEGWAKKRGPFEAVWSVGMRGIHDSGMQGPREIGEQVQLLGQAITDQRTLLTKYVNPDVTQVPQAFMPYKEALSQYQAGLKVPDDVTLVWCEDNFGYIRQLSTPDEQRRAGRAGVYYHISYLGRPKSYLWVNTTPPALIWTEMQKALAYGADRIWVLNVGDIKPGELGMEFWMRLAWKTDRWGPDAQSAFLREWAAREFGERFAGDIASILSEYFALGFARKPELMASDLFSTVNYDEANRRLEAYRDLMLYVDKVNGWLPPEKRDGFFELVAYPVRVAALTNEAFLCADLSRMTAQQGRPMADEYERHRVEAITRLEQETIYYNETLRGGKWRGMMKLKGMGFTGEYATWNRDAVLQWPAGASFAPSPTPAVGIAVNGRAVPLVNGAPMMPATDIDWNVDAAAPAIGVPNGTGNTLDAARAQGTTIDVNVPVAGRYNLFGLVTAPSPDDDSFFVRIDDGAWMTWNDIPTSATPAWRKQGVHELTAGAHRVAIATREDGGTIHAIRFTQRDAAERLADRATDVSTLELPTLARTPGRERAIISVYNTAGPLSRAATARAVEPWIRVGEMALAHAGEHWFVVSIDWNRAPSDRQLTGTVNITVDDKTTAFTVRAVNAPADAGFVEVDRVVSIEAEHNTGSTVRAEAQWYTIPNLGRGGDAVTVMPMDAPSNADVAEVTRSGSSHEYDFDCTTTGPARVIAYCLPTYRIHEGRGLRYAISIDDAPPTIVDFQEDGGGSGEHGARWEQMRSRNIAETISNHVIDRPGKHTLRMWIVDPGVIVDKLVIDLGGLQPSEMGPPETRR